MSDQLDLGEPIPLEAYASVMQRMLAAAEADEPPEWGFFYLPPSGLMEKFAQEHPDGKVVGVLAAPLPIHPNAWALVEHPMEVVEDFITVLESPRTEAELAVSDAVRSGKPAPIVGAWFRCEGWMPPERLQSESERRMKTGEPLPDLSELPDRVDAQLGFAVDLWGRNYMVSSPLKGGDDLFCVEEGDETHSGRQRPNVALRRIMALARTPVPREPDLS